MPPLILSPSFNSTSSISAPPNLTISGIMSAASGIFSGNVGIGTSNPSYPLTVLRNNDGQIFNLSTSSGGWYGSSFASSGTFLHAYTGTTSPITYASIGTYDNIPLLIYQNNTERMRITSSGQLFIGTNTDGEAGRTTVAGIKTLTAGIPRDQLNIRDTTSQAQGVGGAINFLGSYNLTTPTSFASIEAYKENSTDGHYGASLLFKTRQNGGNQNEWMRITSSGNVGIGTSSPTSTLSVKGSGTDTYIDKPTTDTNGGLILRGGPSNSNCGMIIVRDSGGGGTWNPQGVEICAGGTERMRITSSGTVGIGTSNPSSASILDIRANKPSAFADMQLVNDATTAGYANFSIKSQGSAYSSISMYGNYNYIFFQNNDGTANFARIYTDSNGSIGFTQGASATMRMFIDSSNGRVGIGTSSPGYQLTLSTDSAAKPTSNTWTISSDARVKTVLGDFTRGLMDIVGLMPKRYHLNGAYGTVDDGREHVSVIAQDVQTTWPAMVGEYTHVEKDEEAGTETKTTLLSLNTNELQWALVNAIKELAARVVALESQISSGAA